MESLPDVDRWLKSAKEGSSEALGEALAACRAYLLLIAEQEIDTNLRAKGGASDVVQETFIEAQRAFDRFTSDSHEEFLAWLRKILLNNIADFRRRFHGSQKRATDREVALEAGSSSADWRGNLMATILTPSGEMVQQEMVDELERALSNLPEDYQKVIAFRYTEGLPFEEIARRMDRSPNAVQKLFARAIDRLQSEMERTP
jgi:RNA polymerase sigma-70 factor (ECF subfamily)